MTKEVERCGESSTCHYLSHKHSTYAQSYNTAVALVHTSWLSKRSRWNHADRLLFLLRSENPGFHPLFVPAWIEPFDMFSSCVCLRSCRKGLMWHLKTVTFLFFSFAVHSVAKFPIRYFSCKLPWRH